MQLVLASFHGRFTDYPSDDESGYGASNSWRLVSFDGHHGFRLSKHIHDLIWHLDVPVLII